MQEAIKNVNHSQKIYVTVHSVPVTDKNPCKIYKTNKFVAQMDFYLLYACFGTDLAVNA